MGTYQQNIEQEKPLIRNVLVYARVSTDRQVQEGHSLEDQVTRLVKYARDHDWHILEVYKDGGKSGGSTSGRPEFMRMLDQCQKDKEVDAVILEETDRFARDAQDHLAIKTILKKHDVQLIATQQPNFGDDPVGKFVDLVMAGANQLQREITGEKTKRTMLALAEKGLQPGQAIIGYKNSFQKGVPWQVDEERRYFIEEIFRRFHTGNYSIYALERELYDEGFRTPVGKKVRANSIHRTLTDVRYAGKVYYCGKIYKGQHAPIVTMEDIQKSEHVLAKHNRGANRSRKHNFFLAGLVFCKKCEGLMSGEQHKKKSGTVFTYYRCLCTKTRGVPCDQPYAPMDDIHDQLTKWIAAIKFDERFFIALKKELMEYMHEQGKNIPSKVTALQTRKAIIEKKMDKLEDQIIGETIAKERIQQKYIPLKDELKVVEGEIARFNRPSVNLDEKKIDTIIAFLKQLPKLYKAFTQEEKKDFLSWFVEKIWINDRKITDIDYTPAFDVIRRRDMVRISEFWLPD